MVSLLCAPLVPRSQLTVTTWPLPVSCAASRVTVSGLRACGEGGVGVGGWGCSKCVAARGARGFLARRPQGSKGWCAQQGCELWRRCCTVHACWWSGHRPGVASGAQPRCKRQGGSSGSGKGPCLAQRAHAQPLKKIEDKRKTGLALYSELMQVGRRTMFSWLCRLPPRPKSSSSPGCSRLGVSGDFEQIRGSR